MVGPSRCGRVKRRVLFFPLFLPRVALALVHVGLTKPVNVSEKLLFLLFCIFVVFCYIPKPLEGDPNKLPCETVFQDGD